MGFLNFDQEAIFKLPTLNLAQVQNLLRDRREAIKRSVEEKKKLMCLNATDAFNKKPDVYARELVENTKLGKKNDKETTLQLPDASIKAIEQALSPSPGTTAAIKKAEDAIKALDNNAAPLQNKTSALHQIRSDLIKEMDIQHQKERDQLTNLFDKDKTFKATFTDPSAADVRNPMLTALTNAQAKQKQDFLKNLEPDLERMHEVRVQSEASAVFAHFLRQHGDQRAFFDAVATARKKSQQNLPHIQYQANDDKIDYDKMVFSAEEINAHLKTFKTKSNKTITFDPQSKTISFSSTKLGFAATESDMFTATLLARAAGWESISLKIDHTSPTKATAWARKAYNAAIEAGYPPEKITIKVKDDKGEYKVKTAAELFGPQGTNAKPKIGLDKDTGQSKAYEAIKTDINDARALATVQGAPNADTAAATVTGSSQAKP